METEKRGLNISKNVSKTIYLNFTSEDFRWSGLLFSNNEDILHVTENRKTDYIFYEIKEYKCSTDLLIFLISRKKPAPHIVYLPTLFFVCENNKIKQAQENDLTV